MSKTRAQTQIGELTDAIKSSDDLHEFLARTIGFLKEHCKKIDFLVEEDGKIVHIRKVGRHRIAKDHLDALPLLHEKHLTFEVSQNPKIILHARTKRKTSIRRLREIIEVISCGIHVVSERKRMKDTVLRQEKKNKEILYMITKLIETAAEILSLEVLDEKHLEAIARKMSDSLGGSIGIIVDATDTRITFPENRTLEEELNSIFLNLKEKPTITEELLADRKLLIVPLRKMENLIGIVGVKLEEKPSDEMIDLMKRCMNFIPQIIERREKISTRERLSMLDMLNKLNTAVALFSRTSHQTPAFANEKFREYTKEFPALISALEQEVLSSSTFSISTMRELSIEENLFSISTHPVDEGEVMVEISKRPKTDKPIENILTGLKEMITMTDTEEEEERTPSFFTERLRSKMKILLSLVEDKTDLLSNILSEISSEEKLEVENRLKRDISVPHDMVSGIIQLMVCNLRSGQRAPKIFIVAENLSDTIAVLRMPYQKSKNIEEDMKFVVKNSRNLCSIELVKGEIRLNLQESFAPVRNY